MPEKKRICGGGIHRAFLIGGNSTCRAHIRQHYDVYQKLCEENNVEVHHHAVPRHIVRQREAEDEKKGEKQQKLDKIFPRKAGSPEKFKCENVLHRVAQFIVNTAQVMNAKTHCFNGCSHFTALSHGR